MISFVETTECSRKLVGCRSTSSKRVQLYCIPESVETNPNFFAMQVDTKVFLKSLSSGHKDVALATVVSCDPKYKLDDAEITNQFWAVYVNAALVKTEELVRKRKNCLTLGNAEATKIAWPSTFVRHHFTVSLFASIDAFASKCCVNNLTCLLFTDSENKWMMIWMAC